MPTLLPNNREGSKNKQRRVFFCVVQILPWGDKTGPGVRVVTHVFAVSNKNIKRAKLIQEGGKGECVTGVYIYNFGGNICW